MHSTRLFKLFFLLVAIVAVAHASWLDSSPSEGNALEERQNSGEGSSANAQASSGNPAAGATSAAGEEKPTPSQGSNGGSNQQTSSSQAAATSSSVVQQQSSSEQAQQTSSLAASSTRISSSAAAEQTSFQKATSTSSSHEAATTSAGENEAKTTASAVVTTKVEVVTKTNEDGSKETSTSITVSTSTPALNAQESNSDSGMSDGTRNTIIGVVVGIGGAILLGAIALVSWRIWGRRKRAEENDALMDYDHGRPYSNVGAVEKADPPSTAGGSTAPSRSPFQQTLENYHQPAHVNASSNF